MKTLRSRLTIAVFLASPALVAVVASCASQTDAESTPNDRDGASEAGTVLPGTDAAGLEECTGGRFCAVEPPIDAPVSLNGIWGTGPDDVWLAASPDVVIHWDGAAFSSTKLKTYQTLYGIWGSSSKNIWAFSAGDALWHNETGSNKPADWSGFDKDASPDPPTWSGSIFGLWGRGENDIWAVGPISTTRGQAAVWHADGWNRGVPNWIEAPTIPPADFMTREAAFNAVWGDDREVWIVGDKGRTLYSTGWADGGANWNVVDSETSLHLYAVWGSGTGEVWAVGASGVVRRFTRRNDRTTRVEAIPFPTQSTLRSLSGIASNDIWAAGSDGTIAHWDGAAWSLVELDRLDAGASELFAVWASGPEDVWAVGRNAFFHKGSKLLPGTMP